MITRAQARKAVLAYLAKEERMNAPWRYPTDGSFIRAWTWLGGMTAVAYGQAGWPSQSYRLWVWEAE